MRLELMSEWMDCQNDKIEVAEEDLDAELIKTTEEELSSRQSPAQWTMRESNRSLRR